MMKLLIIGHKGQLGYDLQKQADEKSFEYQGLDLPELDITNAAQVEKQIADSKASLLINSAAYTAVDKAESEPELAFKVNRDGAANLAHACKNLHIPMIHISTDYVFDGLKNNPYCEEDTVNPSGVYGISKEEGERAVCNILESHIIIRTAWLYGTHGNNFVKTMLRLCQERETLRVVADQHGCPTCAADLAEAIVTIADHLRNGRKMIWGTYHYCGQGITTWHEFTEKILEYAASYISVKTRKVEAITTAEYPTPAKRPAYSALNCDKIAENFEIMTKPWQESLKKTLTSILQPA